MVTELLSVAAYLNNHEVVTVIAAGIFIRHCVGSIVTHFADEKLCDRFSDLPKSTQPERWYVHDL